jgi:hypothetical protein
MVTLATNEETAIKFLAERCAKTGIKPNCHKKSDRD